MVVFPWDIRCVVSATDNPVCPYLKWSIKALVGAELVVLKCCWWCVLKSSDKSNSHFTLLESAHQYSWTLFLIVSKDCAYHGQHDSISSHCVKNKPKYPVYGGATGVSFICQSFWATVNCTGRHNVDLPLVLMLPSLHFPLSGIHCSL